MKFVHIGHGNFVNVDRILAITGFNSKPVLDAVHAAQDAGTCIDGTWGRRTHSVIFMDSGHVVLSMWEPETLIARAEGDES